MPWIGTISRQADLEIMLRSACYEDGEEGHQWENQWTDTPAPAHPNCKPCKSRMRSKMRSRGLSDDQIRNLFRTIGATWHWDDDKAKRDAQDRKPYERKPRPADPFRVGSNVVSVEELTPEMIRSNAEHDKAWDDMVEGRTALIDQGHTPDEAAARFPMPKTLVYRALGKGE